MVLVLDVCYIMGIALVIQDATTDDDYDDPQWYEQVELLCCFVSVIKYRTLFLIVKIER